MLNKRLRSQLLFVAMLSAMHPAGVAQDKNASDAGKADAPALAPVIPPLIILAPTEVRADPTLARGCWVRLFPEPGYKGANDLTIAGPLSIPSLNAPTGGANGVYWKQKAESLIVGPKARVVIHEHASFRGPSATLEPGTRETKLRSRPGLAQSIDSLKIECTA
ncbi:MAG TPA: hypothetical protein VGE12_03415 [Noviherbaspirillum sp.]